MKSVAIYHLFLYHTAMKNNTIHVSELKKRLGLSEEILSGVLRTALSSGGDFADIFIESSRSSTLLMEEKILKRSSAHILLGAGVRVVKRDETGYAYTSDLSPKALHKTARTAAAICSTKTIPARVRLQKQLPPILG